MTPAAVRAGLEALARTALDSTILADGVASAARRYAQTLRAGGTLFFCGNGGSAADAQHIATEYVVRYSASRRPLAAVALTTDSSLLTAAANDLGFERVFARQVEAICRPGDLLVLHSTGGESPNLLAAARAARERAVATVALLGRGGGALASLVDQAIVVPSDDSGRIQVLHLALEHLIVELVEAELTRGA
ncbi:MAG TPA: SIS domain-containing protein [Gemmatimonadales bacterium]|jgi:D-sedoheptulose 7-phosphate isomerase